MRFILAVVAVCLASSAAAQTGVVKGAYVGCLTEDALQEFTGAAVRKDERHMMALFNKVCFSIEGREFSVVERGWLRSKLRVYAGGDSILLWSATEATR